MRTTPIQSALEWTVAAVLCASAGSVFAAAPAAAAASAELVKRGEYLAKAGDCIACHTGDAKAPLAGGRYIDTPFGGIPSPNITPDKATGIGAWTDDQFYRVMHEGIGHKGEYLYPAMPFPWYTTVTRDDVVAIRAYLNSVPAVSKRPLPSKLRFPYSVRESMLAWRVAFFKAATFQPDPKASDEVNRGGYLVNGLAHCGECHNSRPVAGTSKWRESMQGGVIDSWYAPNITSDMRDGIGGWSNAQIASYLKTGIAPDKGIAAGPMAETVHSLQDMSDADLLAIAAYLKTTPANSNGDDAKRQLFAGPDARGADTYLNYCASCHGPTGKGLAGVIPALDGNGSVTAKGPQNVINVVLGGLEARARYAPMPAIGAGMTDQEVADVTNYVRQTWDNAAPPTAEPGMVASLRTKVSTLMNPSSQQACVAPASTSLTTALAADRKGLRTQLARLDDDNMSNLVDALVASSRSVAPGIAQADLVNGLASAYCNVVKADASLDANQKALRLGHFSQLVYGSATGHSSAGNRTAGRTAQK